MELQTILKFDFIRCGFDIKPVYLLIKLMDELIDLKIDSFIW